MADQDNSIDNSPEQAALPEDDYTYWEVLFWIIGILMIPLTPILEIWLFTPWRGT